MEMFNDEYTLHQSDDNLKDRLISKQQLEIERLNDQISTYKKGCKDAISYLWRPEQWSMKCPEFPKIAMQGILGARETLEDLPE